MNFNKFETFNILMDYDNALYTCDYFSNNSKLFNPTNLINLLDRDFKVSRKFISLVINKKGKDGLPLLKLIFQHLNTNFILSFLLNYYWNKTPLSTSDLKRIIDRKREITNIQENENKKDVDVPLITACSKENDDIIKFLIDQGANINVKIERNGSLETPLSIVGEKGKEFMIKYLIEHGADINTKYELMDYKYHNDFTHPFTKYLKIKTLLIHAIENENEPMFKYFIEHGADININYELYKLPFYNDKYSCNSYGDTEKKIIKPLLYMACEKENEFMVKYLIEHGADTNTRYELYTFNGCKFNHDKLLETETPLSIVCKKGNERLAKYLIDHGANVNLGLWDHKRNETPLGIAYKNGNETIVKYLIEHGADINQSQMYHLMDYYGDEYIFENLVEINNNPCYYCCKDECYHYSMPFHHDFKSLEIKTLLTENCEKENESMVKYLIEHGANVNVEGEVYILYLNDYDCMDYRKIKVKTPLSIACEKENESLVKYLIEHGANVNLGCWEDEIETPLCIACRKGNVSIVRYLIEQGASINGEHANSYTTPLKIARNNGNESIVNYLIEHGAKEDDFKYKNSRKCNSMVTSYYDDEYESDEYNLLDDNELYINDEVDYEINFHISFENNKRKNKKIRKSKKYKRSKINKKIMKYNIQLLFRLLYN